MVLHLYLKQFLNVVCKLRPKKKKKKTETKQKEHNTNNNNEKTRKQQKNVSFMDTWWVSGCENAHAFTLRSTLATTRTTATTHCNYPRSHREIECERERESTRSGVQMAPALFPLRV